MPTARPRAYLQRVLPLLAVLFATLATTAHVSPASADETPSPTSGCVARTADELAYYDKVAGDLVAAGRLTSEQAALYRCHPELALKNATVKTTIIPAKDEASSSTLSSSSAAAAKCTHSGTIRESYGTPESLVFTSTLNWCYDGKHVSNWSGSCNPDVTSWGAALGWSNGGCTRNDFVPYKLGTYTPGGVDHIARGTFDNNYTPLPRVSLTLYIWGHNDGTCDHRAGASGTIYHYC